MNRLPFIAVFFCLCFAGCESKPAVEQKSVAEKSKATKATSEIPVEKSKTGRKKKENEQPQETELLSSNYLLGPEDYEKFRPGRSKVDLLNAVQWRGNFQMATEYKGDIVSAIDYGFLGGYLSKRGYGLWAIFVDDKFVKFVQWPEWDDDHGKVGDFRRLIRAVESEPASISDLDKEAKAAKVPSQIDPGLTAAWLLLKGGIQARRKKVLKRNAELRDQFNASRLMIGMTELEVESVLRAKPIKAGEVEAGSFKIYGSTESLDITNDHYSNILVVFKDGKVSGVYSGYSLLLMQKGLP